MYVLLTATGFNRCPNGAGPFVYLEQVALGLAQYRRGFLRLRLGGAFVPHKQRVSKALVQEQLAVRWVPTVWYP